MKIIWEKEEKKKKKSLWEFYYWSDKQVTQFLEIDLDLGVLASSKGDSIYFFTGVRADFFSSAKEIKDKNVSWFLCNEKCLKKNGIKVTGALRILDMLLVRSSTLQRFMKSDAFFFFFYLLLLGGLWHFYGIQGFFCKSPGSLFRTVQVQSREIQGSISS